MRVVLIGLLMFGLAFILHGCDKPAKPTVNIYRAVDIGDLDQIKRHLFWGTNVNQVGPQGTFPLHVAVSHGRVAIAQELLSHGADVNAEDSSGRTPLHLALASGKVPAAALLLRRGAKDDLRSLLIALVREGAADRDTLGFLMQQGVDVNTVDASGASPLHLAVASGDVKLAKRLIMAGADVNLVDDTGATPLSLVRKLDDLTTVEIIEHLLTQYGAAR